jgi:hypothetical protein
MPMRGLFAGKTKHIRALPCHEQVDTTSGHVGGYPSAGRGPTGQGRSYGDHTDTDTRGTNLTLTLSFLFVHGSALPFRFGSLGQPAAYDSPAFSESAINTAPKQTLIIPLRKVIVAEAFLLSPCFCSLSQVIIDVLLQVLGGVTWQLSKVCFGFKPRKTEGHDLPSCDLPTAAAHLLSWRCSSLSWRIPTISVPFSMSRGPARGSN